LQALFEERLKALKEDDLALRSPGQPGATSPVREEL
jgi:hypothetical protein